MNQTPNPTSVEIVISPKSLERQIKLLDDRLLELQTEVSTLEKTREACYVLLGGAPAVSSPADSSNAAKKAPQKRKRSADNLEASEEENLGSVDFSALQSTPEHAPI